jgi:hypothetical protein
VSEWEDTPNGPQRVQDTLFAIRLVLLSSYITGAIFTFLIVGFACALGGNSSELWRPFVYALLWPVMLPLFLTGSG